MAECVNINGVISLVENNEGMDIGFRDLTLWLRASVIAVWVMVALNIVMFIIGIILGLTM